MFYFTYELPNITSKKCTKVLQGVASEQILQYELNFPFENYLQHKQLNKNETDFFFQFYFLIFTFVPQCTQQYTAATHKYNHNNNAQLNRMSSLHIFIFSSRQSKRL